MVTVTDTIALTVAIVIPTANEAEPLQIISRIICTILILG